MEGEPTVRVVVVSSGLRGYWLGAVAGLPASVAKSLVAEGAVRYADDEPLAEQVEVIAPERLAETRHAEAMESAAAMARKVGRGRK